MSSHGPGCEMEDTPIACRRSVPAHLLMCKPHWYQVPYTTRQRVYAGLDLGLDSTEYQEAVRDAVAAVLERNAR